MSLDSLDIVKELIADTENGQLEFKETTGQLERGMETLCAFLNGIGGTKIRTLLRPTESYVTDQVRALIKTLGYRNLAVKDLMGKLSLTHRPTFRMNYLHPALNSGYIIPLYPNQPNHPKQKYSLTEKGKALLK